MDSKTIAAYDADAACYADEWEQEQDTPTDLYALLSEHFTPGLTADVGCGSGRDSAWLSTNGFPAIGFDASEGLLAEARRRHLGVQFEKRQLPKLDGVADASFANVLCETVIMHLPEEEVGLSVSRMMRLLIPGGTLYLSWRVTPGSDRRDDAGRLYAAFDESAVMAALGEVRLMLNDEVVSTSSGKIVRRVIARRSSSN
jgi:SAM-dependent methyltransferase